MGLGNDDRERAQVKMEDVERRQKLAAIARSAFGRKPMAIPFWTRVKLWFRPPQMTVDMGLPEGDKTAWVVFKEMDGQVFVIRQGYGDTLMREFERMGQASVEGRRG